MAVKKYLDLRGLKVFFKKLTEKFSSKAETNEISNRISSNETKVANLFVTVEELTKKLDNLVNPNNTKIAEIETSVDSIHNELDGIKVTMNANTSGNLTNGTKIGTLESKMAIVNANINELIEKCKAIDNMSVAEEKVNGFEGKLYGLITEFRALKDQITKSTITEDRIKAMEEKIKAIEEKI